MHGIVIQSWEAQRLCHRRPDLGPSIFNQSDDAIECLAMNFPMPRKPPNETGQGSLAVIQSSLIALQQVVPSVLLKCYNVGAAQPPEGYPLF